MKQNRHYLFNRNYLVVLVVLTGVAVDVLNFFRFGGRIFGPETGAESEFEKGGSVHLCCERLQRRLCYNEV